MFPLRDTVPNRRFPIVTFGLIFINLIAFLTFKIFAPAEPNIMIQELALVPDRVSWCLQHTEFLSKNTTGYLQMLVRPFFTSMFIHADWSHLLGNLWFLFIFGTTVEGRLGQSQYLAFYLTCGVAAGIFHVAISLGMGQEVKDVFGKIILIGNPQSRIPTIGASGAIAGILGAYFLLFPFSKILTFFPPFFVFNVMALVFLGFWFGFQFFNAEASMDSSLTATGVAWWAHVGGFLAGLALVFLFRVSAVPSRQPDKIPSQA